MKTLVIDYHYHPNLSFIGLSGYDVLAKSKAHVTWDEFRRSGVDVVFATEHVYKQPERSYYTLQQARPLDANTVLFPGVEAVSAEGIDVMIFAESPDALYSQKTIFSKRPPALLDLIDLIVSTPGLYGSIAHPFCIGNSGIIRKIGEEKAIEAIKRLGGVEIHNVCYRGSNKVADFTGLGKIFRKTREHAELTTNLPEAYYNFPEVTLYTGGSDAHVLVEIGSGMLVPTEKSTLSDHELFMAAVTNTCTSYVQSSHRLYFWRGIYKMWSVYDEAKKREKWLKH